jgi:hypothetical protein
MKTITEEQMCTPSLMALMGDLVALSRYSHTLAAEMGLGAETDLSDFKTNILYNGRTVGHVCLLKRTLMLGSRFKGRLERVKGHAHVLQPDQLIGHPNPFILLLACEVRDGDSVVYFHDHGMHGLFVGDVPLTDTEREALRSL